MKCVRVKIMSGGRATLVLMHLTDSNNLVTFIHKNLFTQYPIVNFL